MIQPRDQAPRIKMLFVSLVAALMLFASLLASLGAAEAAPAGRVGVQSFFECKTPPMAWTKRYYDETVALVRDDFPGVPSGDLVSHIQYLHQRGCGDLLDTYVKVRVTSAQYAWFLAVVDANT